MTGLGACFCLYDLAGRSCQPQYMKARVGSVQGVDVASLIIVDVVCLNRCFATLLAINFCAALISVLGHGRYVMANLGRLKRVSDINSPYARVEVRQEQNFSVIWR